MQAQFAKGGLMPDVLDPSCIPMLADMGRAMKIAKASAPGVDGLMGKLFRTQPKTLAAAYHPLAT
eukprot:4551298-Pyramimonas_sp.AAC.1